MHNTYFVMLRTRAGTPTPLMDDGEMAVFSSERTARAIALENPMARSLGFEIFRQGDGAIGHNA